jgi:uncharacterized protein (TIGR03089 family)
MTSIWSALEERARRAPGSPLVTFVDPSQGQRSELSGASMANAAAKIANALRDEYDLEPGAVVSVRLPQHWQRSAWCAGIWTAGCVVSLDDGPADLVVCDSDGLGQVETSVPIAVVSMHPLGLPMSQPPPLPAHDATITVRQQPDAYLYEPPLGSTPAFRAASGDVLVQSDVLTRARELARDWSLDAGGRLLVTDATGGADGLLAALAVPLAVEGSVVLFRGTGDVAPTAQSERVTATAGPSR